jgi:exodeoxyribonuclease-3
MLRVLTLNILFGASEKLDALFSLLERLCPDIVILQECLFWEEPQLIRLSKALRLSREQVWLAEARPRGSGKRYHIAIASRLPVLYRKTHADPSVIGHCIAEFGVSYQGMPLTIFGAHFDSHNEDLRLVEATYLCSLLAAEEMGSGSYLLSGDLNALSQKDPYPKDLAEKIKQAGTDKYGHPPRFDALSRLEQFGWIDALWAQGAPAQWVTAPRDRGGVLIEYRTDYIFSSPAFIERLRSVEIVETTGLSDHHAMIATFDLAH